MQSYYFSVCWAFWAPITYNTQQLSWLPLLPAAACGLLATAVLNVNNVRDIESDARNGKITLAVRLGRENAINYYWACRCYLP